MINHVRPTKEGGIVIVRQSRFVIKIDDRLRKSYTKCVFQEWAKLKNQLISRTYKIFSIFHELLWNELFFFCNLRTILPKISFWINRIRLHLTILESFKAKCVLWQKWSKVEEQKLLEGQKSKSENHSKDKSQRAKITQRTFFIIKSLKSTYVVMGFTSEANLRWLTTYYFENITKLSHSFCIENFSKLFVLYDHKFAFVIVTVSSGERARFSRQCKEG